MQATRTSLPRRVRTGAQGGLPQGLTYCTCGVALGVRYATVPWLSPQVVTKGKLSEYGTEPEGWNVPVSSVLTLTPNR